MAYRYTAPRFQIFVNNRLSTVNMTVAIDAQLNVDNIDDFLIVRCADAVRSIIGCASSESVSVGCTIRL